LAICREKETTTVYQTISSIKNETGLYAGFSIFLPTMKNVLLVILIAASACSSSKKARNTINVAEVTRIETILSHDSMQGRQSLQPSAGKAAKFIAAEMQKAGLKPFENNQDFLQVFSMKKPLSQKAEGNIDDEPLQPNNILVISTKENISITNNDAYKTVSVNKGDNLRSLVFPLLGSTENILVFIDTSFAQNFKSLKRFQSAMFDKPNNLVFILTGKTSPGNYSINIRQEFTTLQLSNVAGWLPGKTRPKEYVLFSAHYDHLGIGKPDAKGDSVYNGANDDASGVTAMLTLASWFSQTNNNDRSILFVAFTAEELGGFGSTYFSEHITPDSIVAMFNIEMIGTDSKWGTNSAYITGFEKSDFGAILQKNVAGSKFSFYPDPYPDQKLFLRSDNATLAKKGVPAHTISTSKMDNEPHYHKASDEIQTLDMNNMTEIIKAIALGARSIISGEDTPSRIKNE
jgi:hypothetical protein